MADERLPVDILRRAWRANLDYYRALGEVTTVYLRAVSKIVGDVLAPTARPDGVEIRPMMRPAARRDTVSSDLEATGVRPAPRAALVLEAEAGSIAGGVFMVGNSLPREVTAAVEVTPFAAAGRPDVRPLLQIEPALVVLEPGGQTLVQLWAAVDDSLAPGVAYRAEIRVPGMSDEAIPVLLRRREAEGPAAQTDAPPVAKRRPSKRARPERA